MKSRPNKNENSQQANTSTSLGPITRQPRYSDNPITFFGCKDIPHDVFTVIGSYAFPNTPEGDAELLKHVPHNPELANRFKERLVKKLLSHVIRGEQAEAEKMIKSNPHLLLETGMVEDYSGRKIAGTALQLALGAEDVKYHDDEECMVEMIDKYLKQLPNGEEIIAEQTAKQFPDGWQAEEEKRVARDLEKLNEVFDTIEKSANPADWKEAINGLRNYLAFENKSNIIRTGKHFNHQLLVEVFDLYNQNYGSFGGWFDSAKNNAIWHKVIGTIERYVPAATAQALCTALNTIVDEKGKLQRKLTLRNYPSGREISYFPLDTDSGSMLGRDFAVYSGSCGGAAVRILWLSGFSKLMLNKNINLAALIQRPQPQPDRSGGCFCR